MDVFGRKTKFKDRLEIEKDIPLADSDVIDFYNK